MAMANQQFCLRWNNYQTNLTQVFDQLLQSESFVDVTLACEGHSLKAHRMVLSACSPYFQELLSDAPCSHPVIILQGVKWLELKAVVEFMYKGEINISQDDLGSLLRVAEYLKIRGLAEVDGDPSETAVLTSPSISPAARALASVFNDDPISSVLAAAARKRRRLSGGDELISRPASPNTPTSAPEVFEHAMEMPGALPGGLPMRSGGSAPLPGSPAPFGPLPSPHLPGPMPPPQLPPHLPHLPHLPPLSPLLNMHSLSRPHMHDDFEIRPGIAEMIREEERRRRDAPDMAKLLESSHHWMGTSMAGDHPVFHSYQAQVQAAWQKSWNQTQSLLQNLRFRERGPLKSWRPETMAEAIHAVLKEGLSLSQAARKYDIPYPTFVLYANRVHNLLGPSQEPGDLRPKGRGRPQRILLGSWPEDQIKGVIRAVVFRDTSVFKENEHKVGAKPKENKHPVPPKIPREDQTGVAMRPNGPVLPNISGTLPIMPPGTPDNGSFSTAPSTPALNTTAPNTPAPNTPAPSTPASGTPAPNTPAPNTPAPNTPAPPTPMSLGQAPGTPAPNTPIPNTSGPNTPTSSTPAPLTPSASTTPAPATPQSCTPAQSTTPVPVPSITPSTITSVTQPLTTPPTPGSTPVTATSSPVSSPSSNDSRLVSSSAMGNPTPTASNSSGLSNPPSAQTSVSSAKLSPVFSLGNTASNDSNGTFASNGTTKEQSASSVGQQQQAQASQQQQQQLVQQKQQQQQMQEPRHQQQHQRHHQQPLQQQQQQQFALQQMQYQSQHPKPPPHLQNQQSHRLPQQAQHLQMQQQLQQLQQQQQQQQHPQRHPLQQHHQTPPHQQKPIHPRQQLPSQQAPQRQSSQNHHRQSQQQPQLGGLLPTGIPPSIATSLNSPVHLARLFSENSAPHPFAGHQTQHPQAPISPFHPGYPRHPHPTSAMQVLNAMNSLAPHMGHVNSEESEPSPESILFNKITNPHINAPHGSGETNARPSPAHNQFENHGDASTTLSGLVERASMIYRDGLDSIKSEPEAILN